MPTCFQIHPQDNVAVLLEDCLADDSIVVIGGTEVKELQLIQDIAYPHKIALHKVDEGDAIIKYGVTIGVTTQNIQAGEWVHVHNCRSNYDERTTTFDSQSGAPKDTVYE